MIWLVLAFGKVSEGIVIIIKASLQWAPLVGPVSGTSSALLYVLGIDSSVFAFHSGDATLPIRFPFSFETTLTINHVRNCSRFGRT